MVIVKNQNEFNQAVKDGVTELEIQGDCYIENRGYSSKIIFRLGSPQIVNWGSCSPQIVNWGSCSPRIENRENCSPQIVNRENCSPQIENWGSCSPRIVNWENCSPRIVNWENCSPQIENWGSCSPQIENWGSCSPRIVNRENCSPRIVNRENCSPQIEMMGFSHGTIKGKCKTKTNLGPNAYVVLLNGAEAIGGTYKIVDISTPEKWCDYYGVKIENGKALLFKALNEDFTSPRKTSYAPGTKPVAEDWDGGIQECGKGLHFSPSPMMARSFHNEAKKFCGCWIALEDMRASKDGDDYPEKVKAWKVSEPCFEVNIDGEPI